MLFLIITCISTQCHYYAYSRFWFEENNAQLSSSVFIENVGTLSSYLNDILSCWNLFRHTRPFQQHTHTCLYFRGFLDAPAAGHTCWPQVRGRLARCKIFWRKYWQWRWSPRQGLASLKDTSAWIELLDKCCGSNFFKFCKFCASVEVSSKKINSAAASCIFHNYVHAFI